MGKGHKGIKSKNRGFFITLYPLLLHTRPYGRLIFLLGGKKECLIMNVGNAVLV